jgi:DNA polymerase (family 10)
MDKKEVSAILEEIGTLLELKGENPFKSRAYQNASRIIGSLTTDLKSIVTNNELSNVKGIGKGLAEKITELVNTGHLKYYEDLKKSLPKGLLNMLTIPGFGPKKAKVVYEKLKISSINDLEVACKKDRLKDLEGFGQKSQEKILEGIQFIKKHSERNQFDFALAEADKIYQDIQKNKKVIRSEIGGSLRRKRETIKDIDIVASAKTKDRMAIMDAFTTHSEVESIVSKGETRSSVVLKSGMNADLRIVSDKEYPFALSYFTGSVEHNTEMRAIAKKRDWKLNEYGLFNRIKRISCKDEEAIYKSLGLHYIPPELRESMGEIEFARENAIPRLVELSDLKGILHVHTTQSDGTDSLEDMAGGCRKLGYQYLGIADHSKTAAYAGGLTVEEVKKQHKEIDELNRKWKDFKLLKGIELEILTDGRVDYDDKILSIFDFVIAAVHSSFNLPEKEMTKRIINAMENPYVDILAHPTGRLLLMREGYQVNLGEVIDAARDLGKIIELNAHPKRFDLDWRFCKVAKEKGVKISINPDAHSVDGLQLMKYGIGIARKGWIEKEDVLNTLSLKEIIKYFEKRRKL